MQKPPAKVRREQPRRTLDVGPGRAWVPRDTLAPPPSRPPHSGRRRPCSARQEVLPAASDWPPLSSPRAPATRTRRPPGQRGGACPGFPRPPTRGRRESVPSCVPLPCLKRSAAQEAIVTPSCPVRDHSPPQPGEGERPAACFSRLPSGGAAGLDGRGGLGGGSLLQPAGARLPPPRNKPQNSTGNPRSAAGQDMAPACRLLAPTSRGVQTRRYASRFKH